MSSIATWQSCGPTRLMLSKTGLNSCNSASNLKMSSSRGSTDCKHVSALDIQSDNLLEKSKELDKPLNKRKKQTQKKRN